MKKGRKNRLSTGYRHVRSYLNDVTKTKKFKETIRSIRSEYQIPVTGYEREIKNHELSIPPSTWRAQFSTSETYSETYSTLQLRIQELSSNLHLHHTVMPDPLEAYVFYGEVEDPRYGESSLDNYNLCFLQDVIPDRRLDQEIFKGANVPMKKYIRKLRTSQSKDFPISLRIHVNASQTSIIDFIKRAYKNQIAPIQRSYQKQGVTSKLGKTRAKNYSTEERHAFVLECAEKYSHKKIASLVRHRYNVAYSYTYIGRLIARLKKKGQGI